jgi:molybdopterin molybdotransferase
MISFDQAIAFIAAAAKPLGSESVSLIEAEGRVLAADVAARIDSPRSDCSAMDGYAVRGGDVTATPVALRVIGESFPGRGWTGSVGAGECVRIFTGAPLPEGADRIVIQENVRRQGELAVVERGSGPATYVRKAGSDFSAGSVLLPAGGPLGPYALVAVAGGDVATVEVVRRPRLAIIATGGELVEPGEAQHSAAKIPDSASLGVAALAGLWGGDVISRLRLPDDLPAMEHAAQAALEGGADLLVVTGGASVGDKDFAKAMFAPHGLDLIFSRVSIKPGKPVWLGRARGTLVIGLPGNPTSALVTARLLLAPLLAGLTGRGAHAALTWRNAALAAPMACCGERESFERARLQGGALLPLTNQDSSAQKVLAEADHLVRRAAGAQAAAAGTFVEALAL